MLSPFPFSIEFVSCFVSELRYGIWVHSLPIQFTIHSESGNYGLQISHLHAMEYKSNRQCGPWSGQGRTSATNVWSQMSVVIIGTTPSIYCAICMGGDGDITRCHYTHSRYYPWPTQRAPAPHAPQATAGRAPHCPCKNLGL